MAAGRAKSKKKSHVEAPADAPMIDGSEEVPAGLRQVYFELACLLDEFCNERLDAEYQQLFREMAVGLCQEGTPVVRGKRASWASGIAYAIGQVNFLGDPAAQPFIRSEEIARWFGVSTATMHAKAAELRKGFNLSQLDTDWMLPSQRNRHPLASMVEINGYIVDVRSAPPEVQRYFFEQGFIPAMPSQPGQTAPGDEATVRAVNPLTGEALMIGGSGEADAPYQVLHARGGKPALGKAAGAGFVLKITLTGFRPAVWRRVRVADCSLATLHDVIQIAMGWEDCHLHTFSVGGERFLPANGSDDLFDKPARNEAEVLLSELFDAGRKQLEYTYDFGDDWRHKVRIEKQVSLEDDDLEFVCLAGERACPPEDVGGPLGYLDLLNSLADPSHERHDEALEWLGDGFDPEAIDLEDINDQLLGEAELSG